MYMYQRVLSLTDRQIEIILFFSGRSNYISQSDNYINIFKCALIYVGSTNTQTHTLLPLVLPSVPSQEMGF